MSCLDTPEDSVETVEDDIFPGRPRTRDGRGIRAARGDAIRPHIVGAGREEGMLGKRVKREGLERRGKYIFRR